LIAVLIVDDHTVVRRGLEELLRSAPDIELTGSCPDGASAVETVLLKRPQVVLMDLAMPGTTDGIEATRQIAAQAPQTQVVVLTSFSDRDRILAALDAGAVGYLLKDAEPEELLAGIRAAARGESPLAPKAARALLEARQHTSDEIHLSVREREILGLVSAGLPNKAIAQRLGIAEKTVKAHLTSIYRLIGVDDRVQAALWARDRGLSRP
jgi:DNA-binding NarL/FixJ family response regulator